jgi:hypothetical protein
MYWKRGIDMSIIVNPPRDEGHQVTANQSINTQTGNVENVRNNDTIMQLLSLNVRMVHIEFAGEGDSGGIEYTSYQDLNDHTVVVPDDLRSRVDDLIYEKIQQIGADFNNDGCNGTATFDVARRTVSIELNTRIIDYDTSSEVYHV